MGMPLICCMCAVAAGAGVPPFNADSPSEIFEKILDGHIHWPAGEDGECVVSPACRDLITQLLNQVPHDRLGYKGAGEVKMHPFFKVGGAQGGGWGNGGGHAGPVSFPLYTLSTGLCV
jgi:hypothetical protein